MHLKSLIADDPDASTGSLKSHIVSRFHKARNYAKELSALLSDPASNATTTDLLEATAYASTLSGLEAFEKSKWEAALRAFAVSRIIYSVLSATSKSDAYTEQLTATVDPSVRYSAYQLQLPRSMDIAAIARQYFPRDDASRIAEALEKLDPQVFSDEMEVDAAVSAVATVSSVTWRGRTAAVEEAAISISLAEAQVAENAYNSQDQQGSTDAFDAVLLAWQDAVDATRKAIDERQAEGMSIDNPKMQNLQLTSTAVNYSMICWRVGRNRVMISNIVSGPKKSKKEGQAPAEEVSGKKIGHLKEEIALYDAILQSLEQISDLPGVAADESFSNELSAKANFFRALRTTSIARSHALLTNRKNALALFHRAHQYISTALPALPTQPSDPSHEGLSITPTDAGKLVAALSGEVSRYRALVEMDLLAAKAGTAGEQYGVLLERLDQWPHKVDFQNGIVQWPPRVQPVPVKPVFLDIAWNFIEYPGTGTVKKHEAQAQAHEERKEGDDKKGLLGRLWGR